MEFQEIFMSPLTTATTCYSGARNGKFDTIRLATENSLLGVQLGGETDIKTTTEQFPPSNLICVGFSQWDDNNQAMAFVNTSRIPIEDEGPTLSRMFLDRDDTDGSIVTAGAPPSSASVTGSNKSLAAEPSSKASSAVSTTEAQTKKESTSENETGSTKMEGQLVLQTLQGDYTAVLANFRPLCPCVARWGNDSIGVWLGSADDARLRLYIPDESDGTLQQSTSLAEECFTFKTPVMAIDFISTEYSTEVLAVACQDGTIQLITWTGDMFDDLNSYQVIVDGPILSLQLRALSDSLEVVVGSLCGYVCQLSRSHSSHDNRWEGPTMVVQGYQNQAIQAEDSVLTVHLCDEFIAVGTHGGRCILYTYCNTMHFKIWECLLPYSVHSIVSQPEEDSNGIVLLVTTRRSIHVFRQTKCDDFLLSESKKKQDMGTHYSVDAARHRLLELAKKEPASSDVDDDNTKREANEDEVHQKESQLDSTTWVLVDNEDANETESKDNSTIS
jgi:hypothetical protein